MKTRVPADWCRPEETEMFDPVPANQAQLDYGPAFANPRELPNGLDHRFYIQTLDPMVGLRRAHRISGPDQIAHGYEYPSEFDLNWLRPAPLAKETRSERTCRKYQSSLCVGP
eukprot:5180473-Alexandrium_andersonii.AAC.1